MQQPWGALRANAADDLDEDERKQLDESIAVSFEQAKNGQLVDSAEVLAKLRGSR